MTFSDALALYDAAIAACDGFERKGKNMVYTSANGHMFSQVNKAGELGIRFSEEVKAQYLEDLDAQPFLSYGAIMKGYVHIPESIQCDPERVARLMTESFEYVMSLEPK